MLGVMETFEYISRIRACTKDRDFAKIIIDIYDLGLKDARAESIRISLGDDKPEGLQEAEEPGPEPSLFTPPPPHVAKPDRDEPTEDDSQSTPSKITADTRVTAFDGETKAVSEWTKDARCPVTIAVLIHRLRTGWDAQRAIMNPPRMSQYLTEDIIKSIYYDAVIEKMPTAQIAKQWGVGCGTISSIASDRSYRYITRPFRKGLGLGDASGD